MSTHHSISRSFFIALILLALQTDLSLSATELILVTGAGVPGDTIYLPLALATTEDVTALQLDVGFDTQRLTVADPTEGDAFIDHAIDWGVVSSGVFRMVVFSPQNTPFMNGAERLAYIPFTINPDAPEGEVDLELSGVVLSDPNAVEIIPTTVTSGSIYILPPIPISDLEIAKDDNRISTVPGQPLTYTITVNNIGPYEVRRADVTDILPPELLNPTWTCTPSEGSLCTPGPVAGDLIDTVDIPRTGSVTYTVIATVDPSATGSLSNTATVIAPTEITDPNLSNNTSTDIDALTPTADLTIAKHHGPNMSGPGEEITYTITVANLGLGPSHIIGATVTDFFPAELLDPAWTCTPTGGATCTPGPISGDIDDIVNLPIGSSLTYEATATIDPAIDLSQVSSIANTASVIMPAGATDPDETNNTATDVYLLGLIFTDGFESGDLSAWSSGQQQTLGEDPVKVLLRPGKGSWLESSLDQSERRFHARLTFDPDSALMPDGSSHRIFAGLPEDSSAPLFSIELGRFDGSYYLSVSATLDNGERLHSDWILIADAPNELELEWWAAGASDTDDGGLRFWVNGQYEASLTGLENARQQVDRIRAGAFDRVHSAAQGSHIFADYQRIEATIIARQPTPSDQFLPPPWALEPHLLNQPTGPARSYSTLSWTSLGNLNRSRRTQDDVLGGSK